MARATPGRVQHLGEYSAQTGDTVFDTFEQAVAALNLDDGAGGITMPTDGTYTVRAGTELRDSPTGEQSWLKSELFEDSAQEEALAVAPVRELGAMPPPRLPVIMDSGVVLPMFGGGHQLQGGNVHGAMGGHGMTMVTDCRSDHWSWTPL